MKQCTRDAICALLAVDQEATDDERRMVADALAGRKISRPLEYNEVAKLIGCHRNTVRKLVERGTLKTTPSSSGRLRILAWSVEDYITGRSN